MSNKHHKEAVALHKQQLITAGKWPTKLKKNSYYNEISKERIENGQCPRCGNPPEPGYRTCNVCISKVDQRARARYQKMRYAVLNHYGRVCACCGESEPAFLAIDHMPGYDNRKGDQRHLTQWLYKNGFPEGFRTLCHNCNSAIRLGRTCPHQVGNTPVNP